MDSEPTRQAEEITLEDWIAASQSCCGPEAESPPKAKPNATSEPGKPAVDGIQLGEPPMQP